jgi:hypothetical protein
VGVAEPVSAYLAGAPSRVRLVVRVGLRALELTAFPRRFSRMPLERRSAHLEKLEGSRLTFLRDLFLLFKTLAGVSYSRDARVRETLGVEARCEGTPSPLKLDPEAMRRPTASRSATSWSWARARAERRWRACSASPGCR